MRNLLITILAVICFTSVHSQDVTGTWNLDWQNNPYPAACLPQSFVIVAGVAPNQWNVTYTYTNQTLNDVCAPVVQQNLNDVLTNSSATVYADTYGRNFTVEGSYLSFTSDDATVGGRPYIYETVDSLSQTLAFGTLGSNWINPTNTTVETGCCVPDVLTFLPSSQNSGLDLISSTTFYSNNSCTTGVNSTNVTLSLTGSTPTQAVWTTSGFISVAFNESNSPITVFVTLDTTNNNCFYNYARAPAPGDILNNTWQQDWQTVSNAMFPTNYTINSNSGAGFQYMTSQYTLNGTNEDGYVVTTEPNQYTDTSIGQTFTYDSGTQTLLAQSFLYSLNGAVLPVTTSVNFWGNPQPAESATCCVPSYIDITPGPTGSTLNVAYKLPLDYTTNAACSGLTPTSGYNLNNNLSISQPSITQLNWRDVAGNTIVGNASVITVTFNNNQCTFTMTPVTPLPPVIAAGEYSVAWQNNDFQSLCVPLSFTLVQDSYTQAVTVSYSYSSAALHYCPANIPQSDTFTYSGTSNTFTDTTGRSITFDNSIVNFVAGTGAPTFFFQTTGSGISQQSVLGGLGAAWNTPTTSNPTGCCAPDTISFMPSANGLTYSTDYTSTGCAANVNNVPLTLSNSNPTTVSYVDNPTSQTINIQYTPGTSETSITAILTPNTCVYTYQRVAATGEFLANTWIRDWQSAEDPTFPSPYVIATDTTTSGQISYMASQYTLNNDAVNSYVIETGVNQYTDGTLNKVLTYDTNTKSLLSGAFLYSLSGSVLSSDPFIGFWGNAQAFGDNTGNCCIPTYINITAGNSPATLTAYYTFPEEYDTNNACHDFTTDIQNGLMDSTPAIQQPSFTQLTYVDQYQFSFTLDPNSSPLKIVTSVPGQCQFNMVITTPPTPPKPKPKSGSLVSTKVMGLVMGLLMALAWL